MLWWRCPRHPAHGTQGKERSAGWQSRKSKCFPLSCRALAGLPLYKVPSASHRGSYLGQRHGPCPHRLIQHPKKVRSAGLIKVPADHRLGLALSPCARRSPAGANPSNTAPDTGQGYSYTHIPLTRQIQFTPSEGAHSTTGKGPGSAEIKPVPAFAFFTEFAQGGLHMACHSRHNARAHGRSGAHPVAARRQRTPRSPIQGEQDAVKQLVVTVTAQTKPGIARAWPIPSPAAG